MSLASCSYQCTWISDGSTITCSLLGSTGDLYQRYGGTALNPTSISPDWHNNQPGSSPFIRILIMENDPSITESDIVDCISDDDTKWYIDGKELKFNSSGMSVDGGTDECTGYAGCFRKLISASGSRHIPGTPYGGLEILKDLVTPSNGHNIHVKAVVAMTVDNKMVYVQGDATVKMVKSVGTANFANIFCDSGSSFVLDEKTNKEVTCKVDCWQGDQKLAGSAFTRKWFLMEGGAWVQKATSDTFKVNRDMIDTFGDVKVECWSKDATPVLIASDIQTVADASDSYVLSPCPNPADGVFYQTGGPDEIVFSPTVTDKDGNPPAKPVSGYYFVVMDSAGNIQNTDSATKKQTYTLPKTIAQNINEGPIVNITAEG